MEADSLSLHLGRLEAFAPSAEDYYYPFLPTKKVWRRPRRNGFSWPPNWLQVLTWMLVLMQMALAVGLMASLTSYFLQLLFKVFLFIVWLSKAGGLLLTLWIDPVVDNLKHRVPKYYRKLLQVQPYLRPKGPEVSAKWWCRICACRGGSKDTKHCWYCCKCIQEYHCHCFSLNTCVGKKNEWAFLVFLVSSTLENLGLFIASLAIGYRSLTEIPYLYGVLVPQIFLLSCILYMLIISELFYVVLLIQLWELLDRMWQRRERSESLEDVQEEMNVSQMYFPPPLPVSCQEWKYFS